MTETAQPPQPQAAPAQLKRGVVKQVLSGDAIVIRGPPVNGPPKEMTVYLSNVSAPRLAKRPTDNSEGSPDEPYAWESREFLRKKVTGKDVTFFRDFTATSGREHGRIYLGDGENAENVTESAVAEGWLEVRQGTKGTDEYTQKLTELQEAAKTAKKGKWGPEEDAKKHVRDIKWTIDNPRNFVDSLKQKPQKAVIEQVRDGSTVRAFLLPGFHYVTLVMSGVKAPMVRTGAEGKVTEADPFGEEARFYTESRILQRDVEVVLESISNQNFVGSILHPNGNIAEMLLRDGFAKCVDWSIALATCGTETLRSAERYAKEHKLRLWKAYQPSAALTGDKKSFQAKVIEIVMGDAMVIKKDSGEVMKIWLSSIRPPRQEEGKENQTPGRQFRPLYDIPHMFDAREFLRKRLIGKKVTVTVDYVQPKSDNFPEKTGCTVMVNGQNVAEALVSKGLATVVRYRQDDDNRSSHYDALLAAEAKAEKSKNGLHASKDAADKAPVLRIQELQGDVNRSRQFMPYLQRSGRAEGVVEFVASGSRVRLYIPKETCIITFLLSGISCPRASRAAGPAGTATDGEPFGDDALVFTKSRCLQHEVEIEVESMDKAGNFVGYMFIPNEQGGSSNLAELLVEQGLASVHFTAERSKYYNQLTAAEQRAKEKRLNIWHSLTDEQAAEQAEHAAQEKQDRSINYKQVVVTDVQDSLRFAAQNNDDGPKLEKLMRDMRADFVTNPPLGGSYTPRRGDICAAKFVDGQWYRAKVESAKGTKADVLYIDFGNRESTDNSKLAALPATYQSAAPGAKEYSLALVQLPSEDYVPSCVAAFQQLAFGAQKLLLNVEYRNNGDFVTLMSEAADGTKTDLGKTLIEQGHAVTENRRERRLQSLLTDYQEAMQKAKRDRMNIWEYGDFTGSEL